MALRDIRPYMLHAHIQWLDDSIEIPHILVLNGPNVVFPPHLKDSPQLFFNVSSEACQGLEINDNGISFSGRFNGRVFKIEAPLDAIVTVQNKAVTFMVSFARQEDMVADQGPKEAATSNLSDDTTPRKPQLTLITEGSTATDGEPPKEPSRRGLHLVKGPATTD